MSGTEAVRVGPLCRAPSLERALRRSGIWSASLVQFPSLACALALKTAGRELRELLSAEGEGRMDVRRSSKQSLPQGAVKGTKWADLTRFSFSVTISSGSLMGSDFTRKQVDWRHGSK